MDVETILNKANIKYNLRGERCWVQCPEHSDHDFSNAYVYRSSGIYFCYACKATGNLNKFLSFYGKSLTDFATSSEISQWKNEKIDRPVRDLNSISIQLIKGRIEDVYSNMEVYGYLKSLSMSDAFIDKYEISYTKYAQFRASDYFDKKPTTFMNRVLFPVYEQGRLTSVGGRDYTLKQSPKELYPTGASVRQPYNWENLDFSLPVVWNEGWKNLVKLYNITPNVISNFGTSARKGKESDISTWEVMQKTMKLFEVPFLILFLDNDEAGHKYAHEFKIMYEMYGKGQFKIVMDKRFHDNGKGYDPYDCTINELKDHLKVTSKGVIDFNSLLSYDEWASGEAIDDIFSSKTYGDF